MTAETEVRSELSEVSKVAIEEKCGLDMSSYEDLPKVGGDCNGVNKHGDDDKEEDAEDTKVNVNGKDDPDGSYVLVSRSDSVNGDPIDRDLNAECVQKSHIVPESQLGQLGEFNNEDEETVSGEHNCIAEGTDVAPDSSLVIPKVEGDGVLVQLHNATAVVECKGLDGEAKIEEQICPDSASDLEENREFPTMDSEVGHCGTPQHDDGMMESEEQTNLESTAELGEVEESQIVALEFGDLHDGEEKPEEQNNLESNAHFGENKEVKIGKIESEEQTNLESTAELGDVQESQIVVLEVGDLHYGEEKPEEQNNIESNAHFRESEEVKTVLSEAAECKSSLLDGKVKSKEHANIESTTEIQGSQESQVMGPEAVVNERNEASELADETDLPLETEIPNEHVSEENKDSCLAHVEDSIPQAKVLNELIDGRQNPTEFKGSSENAENLPSPADCMRPEIEVGSELVESIISCPTECKLPEVEVRKVIAEKQTKSESPQEVKESEESQIGKPESAESESYQLDNGEGKLEEEEKTDLRMDIKENHESQLGFTDNVDEGNEASKFFNETPVPLKTEITNEHVSDENKDSCPAHVEDSIPQAKVLNELIDGSQNPTEFKGSSENAESLPSPADCMRPEIEVGSEPVESICSCPTECKLPEVEVRKVIAEKQTKLESPQKVKDSEESQIRKPESAEPESYQLDNGEGKLEREVKSDLRMDIQENHESQLVFTDNSDEGNEASKLANETDVLLETEIANEHVSEENNKDSCLTHVEDSISQAKVLNELIDGRQIPTELNGSSENAESLPSPADCNRPEIEVGSEPVECVRSCRTNDAKLKIEIKNDTVGGDIITSCNEVSSETHIGLRSIDPEGKVSTLSWADVNSESEVSNRITDCACSLPIAVNGLDLERHAYDSLLNGSGADMKSESPIENSSSISGRDLPCNDDAVSQSGGLDGSVVNCGTAPHCVTEVLDVQEDGYQANGGDGDDYDNLMCQKTNDTGRVHRDEISTSSPERSSADALAEQSAGVEAVKRPFHFLIKIPRYEDEKLREQIRDAKLQVDETTQQRDAIRVDIQMIRANGQQLHNNYEAVKSEERTARGLVRLKRQEIDSVQSVINKVKNAISVDDIDRRIQNMEHMIQHETLPLKEEKQFIREIKQLKHLREQLASNMGSQDEVQQALDQRDIIEERLKQMQILKKELDCLKDKVSKAEATTAAAEKKCNDESKKLTELHNQFRAANDIRQEAYMHLQNLWIKQKDKSTGFWMYKDDATTANGYALSRDKEALHCICVNQVETIMELWNNNDEFRKEYLRCNTRSTVRRLRTLDGLALGPDEEQTVLPNVVDERSDRFRSTPGKPNSKLPILTLEQEKQVSTVEGEETDGKSTAKVAEQMDQTARTKKPGKLTLTNESATVSGSDETTEMSEEKHKQTKEQQELARKEEELRKEEAAAKLKEQRWLEEKVKAKEALERKRRNAEKALIRAELRAQKEAEQKEKEREKRAKKKERKKAVAGEAPDGNNGGETIPTSESPVVTAKEREIKESPSTTTKRPQKPIQFTKQSKTKSIPPPLRNKGKRRLQQWIWVILTAVIVLALFLLGNIGFYSSLGHNLRMRS